jgi:DNA polymerase V
MPRIFPETPCQHHFQLKRPAVTAVSPDHPEPPIDLNKELAKSEGNTFILQVNSDAMKDAGIQKGDQVIVDRSETPVSGMIVVAAVNNELLIRRIQITNGSVQLIPASNLAPIVITDFRDSYIWGVATYLVRKL